MKKIWSMIICFAVLISLAGCSPKNMTSKLRDMTEKVKEISSESSGMVHDDSNEINQSAESFDGKIQALATIRKDQPRFALVIGNGKYQHAPTLTNPVNDAKDMKQALERLGFQVSYLSNAQDRRTITEGVRKLGNNLLRNPDAVGLFFYAGHAMQINGVNYLIPVGAVIKCKADAEFETFDVQYLLDTMDDAKNDMNIVILDACRNNPFGRWVRSMSRGLAIMDSPTGSIISFATSPGRVAQDGTGRNGTFTKHLLRHINTPHLTIEQMLKRVRVEVIEETNGDQTPWETSSLSGNFCFAGCQDQAEIEQEAMRKAEQKIQNQMDAELKRLEQERADLEAKRVQIEAEKSDMNSRADKALEHRDQATLDNIRKEQVSLAEQRRLLKQEQERIERQKALLTDQSTGHSEKEQEIARLKLEQENFRKERAKLEKLRGEIEKAQQTSEKSRREINSIMPTIGF